MFRFSAFCHERYLGQAGYPTLTRLHGKLSPQLTGLPYLADRATHLSGSTHQSCKRDQNEIRNYRDRRVTSPSWGPPPPCKQALSSQKKGRVNKILMENNLTGNQVLEDAENQIREACEVLQREEQDFATSRKLLKPSEDGAFFIDRDGKHFILNYLRIGKF